MIHEDLISKPTVSIDCLDKQHFSILLYMAHCTWNKLHNHNMLLLINYELNKFRKKFIAVAV